MYRKLASAVILSNDIFYRLKISAVVCQAHYFYTRGTGVTNVGIYVTTMNAIIEPAHDKTYNKTRVASKDLDQPVHPPSTPRVLVYPTLLQKAHAIGEDSDQTAQMRNLI